MNDRAENRDQPQSDAERAALLFCLVLAEERTTMSVGGRRVRTAKVAAAVRNGPVGRRRLLGLRLLKKYCADSNEPPGRIDWQKFHEWLKDHMAELTALKIILSIISILVIL